jgi:hypothetical protein
MKKPPRMPTTTPKCFHNHQQFVSWMATARITGGCYEAGYCTDCTPEYKARMTVANRCEHHEIRFTWDQDGFIQGTNNLQGDLLNDYPSTSAN